MSEETDKETRIERFLTPDGEFHPGSGDVSPTEQLALAVYVTASETLEKIYKAMMEKNYDEVSRLIIIYNAVLGRRYLTLSGSKKGKRAEQLTKIKKSNAYVPIDEDKRGWLSRNVTQRNKKEE